VSDSGASAAHSPPATTGSGGNTTHTDTTG
jgi:hypothetical protein